MATGTGNLPYPGKSYTPFDILTAEELNEDVANIESLADGTGIGDGAVSTSKIADAAVTSAKMLGIDLFARGSAIDGGTPPASGTGQFYIQTGLTTVASFPGNIIFPIAFPNGLMSASVVETNGTGAITLVGASCNSTQLRVNRASSSSSIVSWSAIGW